MKEYKITEEQCKKQIVGVCSGCGGELVPIETVDNAGDPTFWPGCLHCHSFDHGVPEEVHKIARKMVTEHNYVEYNHMDSPHDRDDEYKQFWTDCQTKGACGTVSMILRIQKEITEE